MGARISIAFCTLSLLILLAVHISELYGLPFGLLKGDIAEITGQELTLLAKIADANKRLLTSWIEERRSDVHVAAQSPFLQDTARAMRLHRSVALAPETADWLEAVRYANKYDKIRIIDPASGTIIAGIPYSDRDYSLPPTILEDARQTGVEESIIFYADAATRSAHMHIIRQVGQDKTADGRPILILDFSVDLDTVLKPMLDSSVIGVLGKSAEVVLVDSNSRFLTKTRYPMTDGTAVTPLNTVNSGKPARLAVEGGEGSITGPDYRGVKVLAAYRHIPLNPEIAWGMVVKIDEAEALKPIKQKQLQALIILLGGVTLTLICAISIARWLGRPLSRIAETAAHIESGDLSQRVPLEGTRETIELGRSFNSMVERLETSQEELEQKVLDRTSQLEQLNRELEAEILERKKTADELIMFMKLVETSSDAIGISTPEGRHFYQNETFANLFGEIGEQPKDVYLDENVAREVFKTIMAGGHWTGEIKMYARDRSVRDILLRAYATKDSDGRVTGLVGIHTDITERRRAEEERLNIERQLLHTQKLESLGVLAGGIAHDFNNILTSIVGNTELALIRLNPESPVRENLQRIEKGAVRASDLAKQMLAYSGKGKFVVEMIDLNRLVEEMGHMLDVSISKKAVLRFNLTKPLPSLEADATQIRQIVMNLVINASEAIGDKSGVIAVTTGCMNCDQNYLKKAWLNNEIPEGLYVFLEVADTGCGMDKETQAKLFEPFFTTKFTGRGLGMAAVQGIVRSHKGAINVYSEPGKGSSFKILLPVAAKPAELFNVDSDEAEFKGEGTILLADDEETVRAIGTEMLKELGFTVITAVDGRDAVDKFKENPGLFCVILDLTMPHIDGEQAFRELRTLDQDVKVIMSSGYSEYEVTQNFAGKGLAAFIQKPYKLTALREVLGKI